MNEYPLWRRTLGSKSKEVAAPRELLRQAFLNFRDRVKVLVGEIAGQLPSLTVHDITHLDALWRTADEIAGPGYPLNPAEAFVLGGAFLIHDAAHVMACYDDGLEGIKRTVQWKDTIAQSFDGKEPDTGTASERSALLRVLRELHASSAQHLLVKSWRVPTSGESMHLLEHHELRTYYGDLIGEIAQSHHWSPHRVAETFKNRHLTPPTFLAPADWPVDALKVAFLLRVADAAHVDALRAPWFLFAIRSPGAASETHWNFQAKLGKPVRTQAGELRLSSGSPFDLEERPAWWLAYQTAQMIDRELRDARRLLLDTGRAPFATIAVEHVRSPESFANNVPTAGWEPVDVGAKISDVAGVIASLGGKRLYGDRPELALRELIQNGADSIRALRALGGLKKAEGEIEISIVREGEAFWLHVSDTGLGMSRYVLTEVLLDFGNSLWKHEAVKGEVPGLASSDFAPVGQFGIGFFSVFMLGERVTVRTRRFRPSSADRSEEWILEFSKGLREPPALRRPSQSERLAKPGTTVSVLVADSVMRRLASWTSDRPTVRYRYRRWKPDPDQPEVNRDQLIKAIGALSPTLDVTLKARVGSKSVRNVIRARDWRTCESGALLDRLYGNRPHGSTDLIDLREESGELVGRLAPRAGGEEAVLTNGGIVNGSLEGAIGVALSDNNPDLARREAFPVASRQAWKKWASEWLDRGHDDEHVSTALHPFCPERIDLSVFRVSGDLLNEEGVREWLETIAEICILTGSPTYEDWDPISKWEFESLELSERVLILPERSITLATHLGFKPVNYWRKLRAALESAWGGFTEEDDDEACIAVVEFGNEITRPATIYRRLAG